MSYLFWAHVIFWSALFSYVFALVRKPGPEKRVGSA
jgi:hypothetical protein